MEWGATSAAPRCLKMTLTLVDFEMEILAKCWKPGRNSRQQPVLFRLHFIPDFRLAGAGKMAYSRTRVNAGDGQLTDRIRDGA